MACGLLAVLFPVGLVIGTDNNLGIAFLLISSTAMLAAGIGDLTVWVRSRRKKP